MLLDIRRHRQGLRTSLRQTRNHVVCVFVGGVAIGAFGNEMRIGGDGHGCADAESRRGGQPVSRLPSFSSVCESGFGDDDGGGTGAEHADRHQPPLYRWLDW